ncbi:MAG: VCBS repeat-containing protein [Candidatus Methanoperedens sp.]|nr:VCBS repeat-containing protein [Candidatus Methanoperedens sp.]MCE8427085.1 VCBS repeat-containing protein [Candidatus Methanoperedens sp.]
MNLRILLISAYIIILIFLFIYGNNCLLLAFLHRNKKKEKTPDPGQYPMVTIQLPAYNELYVVERLIRKVAGIDYPKDRFEIQVLDDSNDETTEIIERCVKDLKGHGFDIYFLHRSNRDGYKAGALRDGLKYARGEFIAVFDADFMPDPGFLKKCMPYFSDQSAGMVQTRWGHINEDYSVLTKTLSIGIDGHFQIEQATRYSQGLFLNFNGTAGIWRRRCIDDSGGWQSDTLTEDLDLSYRAQLLGWRLVFLDDVVSPAEVPVQINAFKRQQFRWAKGSIQCAKKLLPEVAMADITLFKKIEAMLHLTYYMVHPMMVALLLLSLPLILFADPNFIYFKFFTLGTFGPLAMYALSQKELYKDWKSRLKYLPMLTIIGTGISANNTSAVIEALLNRGGVFHRTPKFGIRKSSDQWNKKKYRLDFPFMTVVEFALGIYAVATLYFAFVTKNYFLIPFLALYAVGYFYISGLTIIHSSGGFLGLKKAAIIGILALAASLRIYRAMMGDLSEDPYHHWLFADFFAATGMYSDPFGATWIFLPGYNIMASGILAIMGRDIIWLKSANILFSLGGIYLAYLIAGKHSWKAGILAATFLALNPFEILTSSTSYTEPLAVFFFLLTVHLLDKGKEKAAGIALLISCATRYEVWLAIPFLLIGRRLSSRNKYPELYREGFYLIAPSIFFILSWCIYTFFHQSFFPGTIITRSREVLNFEVGTGAVSESLIGRMFNIVKYFFFSSFFVYTAGLLYAAKNIRNSLSIFAIFIIIAAFLATGLGMAAGSFRYFSIAIPLLCIFGGIILSGKKRLSAFVLLSLIIVLPFYFNIFSGLDVLYRPAQRAGEFTANATGVISNSPLPLYYSGLSPGELLGAERLYNMSEEQAIRFLRRHNVDYIIYADSPPGSLEKAFPGIEKGKNTTHLELVYDPNGWEEKYGAKKVFVYRLKPDGMFEITGSYISSSPVIADIDGDGYGEIIAASDMLYVWKRDGSSLPGFPARTEGLIASTPGIAYTAKGAIIIVGSDDNRIYAWWYNGQGVTGFPKTTQGDIYSKPLIADMDNDGTAEVVAGSDDGKVYAWHLDGSPVKGWPVNTGGYVSSSPVSADFDGDGKPEIIAGSWDGNLYAWYGNGSLYPGFPRPTGDAIWSTPQIADIDGDGSPDILAASDKVYAWNNKGKMISGFPLKTQSYIISSPLVKDIDLDGKPEIIVASDALYVYNSTGALKKGFPASTGYYFWASPSAADLDGKGQLDIVIGDLGGKVYAFKPDGSIVKDFPKMTGGKIFATSAIGDIDHDSTMEIVAGSWDKNIYLWKVFPGAGSYRQEYRNAIEPDNGHFILNSINISKDNDVLFLSASISGKVDKPKLHYMGDDGNWHPSPFVLSGGMQVAMIAPQKQEKVKYYITLENENISYRLPPEGNYEIKN